MNENSVKAKDNVKHEGICEAVDKLHEVFEHLRKLNRRIASTESSSDQVVKDPGVPSLASFLANAAEEIERLAEEMHEEIMQIENKLF